VITRPDNLAHEFDAYHVSTFQDVVAIQAEHTLEAFNVRGETSLQYGHPAPLLDFWTGGLLAMSAIAILLRPVTARGAMLAGWVWLTLFVGSVMTVDALFSPRVLAALPGLVLGPALMLDKAWRAVTRLAGRLGTYAFALPVIALLALALQANVHDYFDVQIVDRQPAGRFTLLTEYAQNITDRYRLYAIGHGDWSFTSDVPRFLLPDADAVNVRNGPLALPLPPVRVPTNKGVAFLVENSITDYDQRMNDLRLTYPGGRAQVVYERPGTPLFTSYLVEHSELVAVNLGSVRDENQ
jgi:hypothetical protein